MEENGLHDSVRLTMIGGGTSGLCCGRCCLTSSNESSEDDMCIGIGIGGAWLRIGGSGGLTITCGGSDREYSMNCGSWGYGIYI